MRERRRIYLMRHGQVAYVDAAGVAYSSPQRPLSEAGRSQARAAGTALARAGVRFDRVVSSDLPRTIETAQLVLRECGCDLPIQQWPQLQEISSGNLDGLNDAELEHEFQNAFQGVVDEGSRFLRGETFGSLIDRVHGAIARLLAERDWDTLLAVLHGGVNRAILSYALTGSRMFLGNFQQAPACINILDVDTEWVVRAVNVSAEDALHLRTRATTMEEQLAHYRERHA